VVTFLRLLINVQFTNFSARNKIHISEVLCCSSIRGRHLRHHESRRPPAHLQTPDETWAGDNGAIFSPPIVSQFCSKKIDSRLLLYPILTSKDFGTHKEELCPVAEMESFNGRLYSSVSSPPPNLTFLNFQRREHQLERTDFARVSPHSMSTGQHGSILLTQET
jgi:hypothetical protein